VSLASARDTASNKSLSFTGLVRKAIAPAFGGGNIAFTGDEHDRTMIAAGYGQHALNLQTIKTGHRIIEYGAAGNGQVVLFEEYLRRRI